jgi:hypothetical protein
MSIWSTTELNEQITAYKSALLAIASGQDYTDASGRRLTHADLPEIRRTLAFLEREQNKLAGTSGPQFVSGRVRR